jgi:DNA-binding response OmpR family regulator
MHTILVIEDDNDLRDVISTSLLDAGYQVEVAETSEAGFNMVKNNKPELILLDMMTNSWHGLKFLEELRKLPTHQNDSKVIVLTNLDSETTREQTVSYRVDDYIVKANSSIEDIIKKVGSVLK